MEVSAPNRTPKIQILLSDMSISSSLSLIWPMKGRRGLGGRKGLREQFKKRTDDITRHHQKHNKSITDKRNVLEAQLGLQQNL